MRGALGTRTNNLPEPRICRTVFCWYDAQSERPRSIASQYIFNNDIIKESRGKYREFCGEKKFMVVFN